MKILFITNGYKPNRWAGTETYTAGLAEEIQRMDHDVQVLCAGEWERGDTYWKGVSDDVQDGVQVRRIHMNWAKSPDPFRYLYDNPVVADYLTEYLHEVQPDLVQVTSCETLSASVLRVVKAANVPLVLSLTDFWFLCPRITLLHGDGHNCDGNTTPGECLECLMMHTRVYRLSKKIFPQPLLLPLLEKASRMPSITRLRGLRGWSGNMEERKAVLQQALTLPDILITASNFVRDIFISNGVTAPILVRPYGHDLSWLEANQGKTGSEFIRFGYIGQIIPAKGLHLALEALRKLRPSEAGRCSLAIYGHVDQMPSYARRIRELASEIENVFFRGTYQHAESARIFSEIDVLLVPSIWYDFPLIIDEAHATGTPVIATNLRSMAEAVENERNGLLFERGNVDDLALQLQRVVMEPDLLGKLQLGIPRVRTNQEDVDDLLQLFQKLTTSPLVLCLMNIVAFSTYSPVFGGW